MKKKIFIVLIIVLLSFFVFLVIEKKRSLLVNKKFVQPVVEEKVFGLGKIIKTEEARSAETENVIKKEEKNEVKDLKVAEVVRVLAESKKPKTGKVLIANVPFLAQAPYGAWSDPRQQNGCEEASSLIAISWVQGQKEVSKAEALKSILAISKFEVDKYGGYNDTSASSTIERILAGYFKYKKAKLKYDVGADDIIAELEKGNLVIAPFDGQKLKNKYFTAPGPDRHMLVIIGYDYDKKEFITNDPGTRQGKDYRYGRAVLVGAIRDYPTGEHLPILRKRTAMIVISK